MKKYYYILLLLSLVCAHSFYGQNAQSTQECNANSTEYKTRYDKIKMLYVKMLESEVSKEYNKLKKEFEEKAKYNSAAKQADISAGNTLNMETTRAWIAANIEKTNFLSLEEVDAAITRINEVQKMMLYDNIALYKYLQECVKLCGTSLLTEIRTALIKEYGDRYHI